MGTDTIVAVATPPGRGGVGIVRVSGPMACAITRAIAGTEPEPRQARLVTLRSHDGAAIDRGLVLYFPAPHSFTGEDVLEIHAHGSPVVLDRLLRRACELGARLARAGEFSERAFLNDKLDLAQAEAVADLIAARSSAQADAALRSLEGEFSRRVTALAEVVVHLRVEIEAAIDFAEDASESASETTLARLFTRATTDLEALLAATRRGARLTDGLHAVIVGAPNVGKSSLMNALAGNDRAIVTEIPGTTRDVLRESITLDGIELSLADTAGLRESVDRVEAEGIRRAHAELASADLVLLVVTHRPGGDALHWPADVPTAATRIVVVNKIDLVDAPASREQRDDVIRIALSARTGAGMDLLRTALRQVASSSEGGGTFSARTRHVLALERAGAALAAARAAQGQATPELVAEELRVVHQALGEILGTFTSEDLLGAIFSTFCVGK